MDVCVLGKADQPFWHGEITAVSTSMTAASLLGFSFSGNIFFLCLSAVPLGLGAGAIDTALNNYVALHYKGTHMNFLHCFYGVGISLSPFLMSFALSATSWRNGYRMVFCFQACIGLLTIVTLPLWKKVNHLPGGPREVQSRNIAFLSLIRSAKVRKSCQVFIGSCRIEYTCGVWGATFLVNARDMSASVAALDWTGSDPGSYCIASPAWSKQLSGNRTVLHRPGKRSSFPQYASDDAGRFWQGKFSGSDGSTDGSVLYRNYAPSSTVRNDCSVYKCGPFSILSVDFVWDHDSAGVWSLVRRR